MNVSRARLAIDDLLDCLDIYRDRCLRHGYVNEGDELVRLGARIHHRFAEVSKESRVQNIERAWAVLYHSLERCQERVDYLKARDLLDSEEVFFIRECMEEVHKYIRRYFAKKEDPNWRRGA